MKKSFLFFVLIFFLAGGFSVETMYAQKKVKGKIGVAKKYQWSGEWNMPSRYFSSTLTITKLSASRFKFQIEATNGANVGEISGFARITGNKAYFDDMRSGENEDGRYGCRLTFTHKSNLIKVVQNQKCNSYAGLGVVFENDYLKGRPAVIEQNFVQRDVFPNLTLDRKFKTLVGKDYENFLDAFHQIYFKENDSDNINAKVYAACVRGICPWNAGIIMYDPKGNFWAAVLEIEDSTDKTFVHYYTNVSAWRERVPKTIEEWIQEKREMNDDLSVIYMSKK